MPYTLDELLRLKREGAAQTPAPGALQVRPETPYNTELPGADTTGEVEGSKFVNFARYFGGNAEKSAAMAKRVGDNVQGHGDSLQADAEKANTDFYGGLNSHRAQTFTGQSIEDAPGTPDDGIVAPTKDRPERPVGGIGAPHGMGKAAQGLTAAAPGAITPAEAQARASQSYSGPTGLAGYDKLLTRASDVGSEANALTTQAGRTGLMSDEYGTGLTSRAAALDAALAGTAGQGRFGELQKRLGGSVAELEGKQKTAQDAAKAEKELTEAEGKRWGEELGVWQSEKEKAAAKKAADEAAGGAEKERLKKKKTLDEYMTPDAAYWLERGVELTSPIDSAARNVFGVEGVMPRLTDMWEKNLNHPIGSHRSAKDALGPYTRPVQEAVYDSMTQEEADALAGMNPSDQRKWIFDRVQRLGLTGTNERR